MKKDRKQKRPSQKLSVRRESLTRLDPETLTKPAAAGACFTHYCRSGHSCLCSSG
jgi:hypothetical protein